MIILKICFHDKMNSVEQCTNEIHEPCMYDEFPNIELEHLVQLRKLRKSQSKPIEQKPFYKPKNPRAGAKNLFMIDISNIDNSYDVYDYENFQDITLESLKTLAQSRKSKDFKNS